MLACSLKVHACTLAVSVQGKSVWSETYGSEELSAMAEAGGLSVSDQIEQMAVHLCRQHRWGQTVYADIV